MSRLAASILSAVLSCISLCASSPNALVHISVASLRAEPRHSAELETQALMGTPILVDSIYGDWAAATLPDGYHAWIPTSSFTSLDSVPMRRWQSADRLIFTSPFESHIYSSPSTDAPVISDISLGCIVQGSLVDGAQFAHVSLPDGRSGYVQAQHLSTFNTHMSRPFDSCRIISLSRSLLGVPYLWGGRSAKSVDCSGLTQLCWFDQGLIIPRNASEQAGEGLSVPLTPEKLQQADLLFFENDFGRVVHVAVYDHHTLYLHSSGMVHQSSFDPTNPLYNGRRVSSARRIVAPDSNGRVIAVRSHPWYFNIP